MKFQINEKAVIGLCVFSAIVGLLFFWRIGNEEIPGDVNVKTANYRLEDGEFQKAEEEFKAAIAKTPDRADAHLGLGLVYMSTGRNKEALNEMDLAIEFNPDSAIAYADRGILHDKMGQYEKALEDYKQSIRIDPELVEGPGFLWRFMRNVDEKPPQILDRAKYLAEELQKPADQRLLSIPELDGSQRMHKKTEYTKE